MVRNVPLLLDLLDDTQPRAPQILRENIAEVEPREQVMTFDGVQQLRVTAIEADHYFVRSRGAHWMLEHFRIERMHVARDRHFANAFHDSFSTEVEILRRGYGGAKRGAGNEERYTEFQLALQSPPRALTRPTVAWYCVERTCSCCRRLRNSLRRASSSSSWLT